VTALHRRGVLRPQLLLSSLPTRDIAFFIVLHRRVVEQVDTNILNVDMAALGNEASIATGDPALCSGCRACLSAVSTLTPASAKKGAGEGGGAAADDDDEGVYEWACEFCHQVNQVELDEMEKPVDGQDSVDYVLEAAPAAAAAAAAGKGHGSAKVQRASCGGSKGGG